MWSRFFIVLYVACQRGAPGDPVQVSIIMSEVCL